MNRIKDAFDSVKADEELINNTLSFLREKRGKKERRMRPVYKYASVFAAVFVILFGIGGYSAVCTAVSYISIDVNPSVELSLNRFGRVIKAEAYNDDGAEIIEHINLKGKTYTDAIEFLLSYQVFTDYIQDDGEIVFTVISDKETDIIENIKHCSNYGSYTGSCHTADAEIMDEAHECGLSFGKYRAYEELSEYDSSVTPEECRELTMHEIHCMIEEHSGETETTVEENYGSGHHGGGGHHGNTADTDEGH